MSVRNNQSGFSVIELAIVLAVVGVLGFVGYNVYNRSHNATTTASTSTPAPSSTVQSPIASNVSSAPTISTTSDLDKSAAMLDQNDPGSANSSDSSELNSQSNF
jgi:prepilin-type N-terminal cleavage/methylation domain-containing protein